VAWLNLTPIIVAKSPLGNNLHVYWGELELCMLPDFCEVKEVLRLSSTGDIHITYWSNITGFQGVLVAQRALLDQGGYEKEMTRYLEHLESEFWYRLENP
jgi:hypothetical protein